MRKQDTDLAIPVKYEFGVFRFRKPVLCPPYRWYKWRKNEFLFSLQCTTPKLDILRGDFGIWFMVFSSVFGRHWTVWLCREFFFMQRYTIRFFFFWSSWIRKKFECKRNLAGLVWWEIKNVLHVRIHTCKYAISGLKMVRFEFFFGFVAVTVNILPKISLWAQFYWGRLGLDKVTRSNSLYVHL